jgi:hypothetical protein
MAVSFSLERDDVVHAAIEERERVRDWGREGGRERERNI